MNVSDPIVNLSKSEKITSKNKKVRAFSTRKIFFENFNQNNSKKIHLRSDNDNYGQNNIMVTILVYWYYLYYM